MSIYNIPEPFGFSEMPINKNTVAIKTVDVLPY